MAVIRKLRLGSGGRGQARAAPGSAPAGDPKAHLAGRGALVLYCASCATMVTMSIPAFAIALGVAGVRPVATPLDGFLNVWGLPLLLASVGAMLWLMRKAARPAVGLVAAGGVLTVAGMLLMGPVPAGTAGNPHAAHLADTGFLLLSSALFWVGAGMLALGYAWGWRTGRGRRIVLPLEGPGSGGA